MVLQIKKKQGTETENVKLYIGKNEDAIINLVKYDLDNTGFIALKKKSLLEIFKGIIRDN